MPALPTKISQLNATTIQLTDQIPIARGSGPSGMTYKVLVKDLVGGAFSVIDTPTINLTLDSTTLQLSAEVIDDSITNLKLRNSTSLSVIGRSANTAGDPADIAAATNGQVLRVNTAGTVLGFGPVDLANSNAVTNVLPISAGGSGSSDKKHLIPVGAIMPMATPVAPVGWLYCDGSTIPNVGTSFQGKPIAELQELRNLLGYTYDPSGSTSFGMLPDLRGMFVRGWDDGRGKDSGRTFASDQLDAFQGHKHGIYDPQHRHQITDPTHTHSAATVPGGGAHTHGYVDTEPKADDGCDSGSADNGSPWGVTINKTTDAGGSAHDHSITVSNSPTGITQTELISTNVLVQNPTADSANVGSPVGNSGGTAPRTADETRPENVALYYCIKY